MLLVVLQILKITGIVLLAVLLFVLLLILVVLFVPVRYRADALLPETGDGAFPPEGTQASLKFSFLLHLINGGYAYNDERGFYVRIALFELISDRKKKKKENRENKETKPAEAEKTEISETAETAVNEKADAPVNETDKTEPQETVIHEEASFAGDTPVKEEKLKEKKETNIGYTISSACDKIDKVRSTVDSPIFERAVSSVLKELKRIVRWLLPSRIKGNILAGTGDPYSTAQVMSFYGVMYPLLKGRLGFSPDFERKVIEGELHVRGKMRLITPAWSALKLFLNRDVRRTIRRFRYITEA